MKSLVKDVLKDITGKSINNEAHAVIVLKKELIDLGGEDFAIIVDDVLSILEFIEVYRPEISELITDEFKNSFVLDTKRKRIGKRLKPNKYKIDRGVVDSLGKTLCSMHNEMRYVVHSLGISLLKNNRVICSVNNFMSIEGPVKEYSAEVTFNYIESECRLKDLVPKKYWDGKTIGLVSPERKKTKIKYLTTTELIDIFTNNKIVEESCLKDG